MSGVADASSRRAYRPDRLGALVLVYLALPNIIFLAGWLRMPYALIATLLVAVSVSLIYRQSESSPIAPAIIGLAVVVALPWLCASGIGHLVYANMDWRVRDAVLRDLTVMDWPVVYHGANSAGDLLLRAPLGYYMVVASIARIIGIGAVEPLLFLWSLIGVVLVFVLIARQVSTVRDGAVRLATFIAFSGMDIIGTLMHGQMPVLGSHIEWWAGLFQYSSITTQLFWVPNHALPAWLVTAWLLDRQAPTMHWGLALAMTAMVPLWSPLAAIGIVPFVIVRGLGGLASVKNLRTHVIELLNPAALVIAAASLALVCPYLTLDAASVPAHWSFEGISTAAFTIRYLQFVFLEFGLFAVLLFMRFRFDPMLIVAIFMLLVLPLYTFGPGSDLTMRASIPSLMVISWRLSDWFVERWQHSGHDPMAQSDWRASIAMLAFAIGVITPGLEVTRIFVESDPGFQRNVNVIEATQGEAPHYLSRVNLPWVHRFLRLP